MAGSLLHLLKNCFASWHRESPCADFLHTCCWNFGSLLVGHRATYLMKAIGAIGVQEGP